MLQIGIFLLRSHGRRKTSAPMHEMDLAPFWGSLPYRAHRRTKALCTRKL